MQPSIPFPMEIINPETENESSTRLKNKNFHDIMSDTNTNT